MDNIVAGLGSGIAQSLVGHPLDTLKVYSQELSFNKKVEFKNLYRGISYPLITNSFICSINFYTFEYFKNNYNYSPFIAGAISGIPTGIIINPIEISKIKRQLFIKTHIPYIKGLNICILREVLSYSMYFQSYYSLRDNNVSILNAGGIAGIAGWLFSYPIDVIKTRIQSGKSKTIMCAIKQNNLFKGMIICIIRAYPVNAIGLYAYEYIKTFFIK
jgi:solute carrier family 25 (mitochondrial carnitine/acylcarnitine transporter), member 20/29